MQQRFSSEDNFGYGKTHEQLVGPHTEWQFKIVFTRHDFTELVNWLIINRPLELSILVHPHTLDSVGWCSSCMSDLPGLA